MRRCDDVNRAAEVATGLVLIAVVVMYLAWF